MKKLYCRECDKITLQNPRKKAKPADEQLYRCVECGFPRRTGMAWNRGLKIAGRIVFTGPGA